MSKIFWQVLKAAPAVIGASLLTANSSIAAPETVSQRNEGEMIQQIEQYNNEAGEGMSQVTSVSEFRDVSPGDWAYEALRNLVERYGCIEGYPDQTYRGFTALSRYEFAAGLSSCLQQIERLVAASEAVAREDLERAQLLMQEFEAELAAIGARVDNLDGRVAFLEDNQFSTTTTLSGSVIMNLSQPFGDQVANGNFGRGSDREPSENLDSITTLGYRVRLNFDTSFNGRDRLRTRLQAGNIANYTSVTGTETSRLGFDGDSGGDVSIEKLWYNTPIGDNFRVHVAAAGVSFDDIASEKNPFFASDETGALSRFGRRNPAVYRTGSAAVGANFTFGQFGVDVAYLVDDGGADPTSGNGLFNGDYLAIGQFNWDPNDKIGLALTYGYGYNTPDNVNLSGSTGSLQAKDPFDGAGATAHRIGAQGTFRIAERFNIAGWFGSVIASPESGDFEGEEAWVWNAAVNFAFLDLIREGSLLGLIVGIPPRTDYRTPDNTTYFVEALYRYPITDNISITPGAYVIINPNQNDSNDTIVVGSIRTTFKF